MIDDDELEKRLLSYIVVENRKVMRVIASVFADIGYESRTAKLWGSGDDVNDALLERAINCLNQLSAARRIETFGDTAKPRFSEVRLLRS